MACAHCGGSGWCKHAGITYDAKKSIVYRHCSNCGSGKSRKYSYVFFSVPSDEECKGLEYPGCGGCKGRGY